MDEARRGARCVIAQTLLAMAEAPANGSPGGANSTGPRGRIRMSTAESGLML